MSKWAGSKGSDSRSHTERLAWSDRGHDDDRYVPDDAPWHRGAPAHHMRWDPESTGDRASDHSDGSWLPDRGDQDWDGADGLIAMLGGVAMAAGDAAASIGFLETVVRDNGFYSIATGEAVFEASAWSAEPGGAAAAADVFVAIAGADFIFQREFDASASGSNEAWAYAGIEYLAIDFHAWSPRHGPIVFEFGASLEVEPYRVETPLGSLAGTGAAVAAVAEAYGADSLSGTFTEALTVENQFSFVQAMGLVAV